MSKRWNLSRYDIRSRLINIVIFFAPVAIYVLNQVVVGEPINRVTAEVIGAWLILNLLKKLYVNNAIAPIAPVVPVAPVVTEPVSTPTV